MQVEQRALSTIRPYANNPRRNDGAVDAVAASIAVFGFRQPIVVDEKGEIIVGHTRYMAAQRLGLQEVPVHVAHGLTPGQVKAYRIADNRTASLSEWDDGLLVRELTELQAMNIDVDLTGFSADDLQQLLAATPVAGQTDPDAVPEPPDNPISQPGDIWVLGRHRLMCGDAGRHRPVVLDDVDGWYAQRDGIRLLKCLTQSERIKSVSWHTEAPTLRREKIPQEFRTSSRVAIIANEWQTLNRNVAALQDRGHVVFFEPSPLEVHRQAAEWFWDQEIFDFVQARLHWVAEASLRHYLAAWELKQAGLDWRSLILSRYLSGRALQVAQLKADPRYASEAQRVQAFVAAGGGSRSTYFNWSRRLQAQTTIPDIRLRTPPPVAPSVYRDLRRR